MRKGYIKIADYIYSKQFGIASEIFKHFRPTHIEYRHWENDLWYLYGTSDFFDELKEGDEVPQYECNIEVNIDTIVKPILTSCEDVEIQRGEPVYTVSFVRMKN